MTLQPHETVERLITGFRATSLIGAAVRSGLFESLSVTPRACEEVASASKLHPPAVRRVLRGLVLLELALEEVDEKGQVRYALTPAGQLLRSDAKQTQTWFACLSLQQYTPAWMRMETALRDGSIPFEAAFGTDVWQYRQVHADEGRVFDAWLDGQSSTVVDPIVDACDFEGSERVADIGGGRGALLAGVLRRHPGLQGVLADQGSVLAAAKKDFEGMDLSGRCEFIPIDFFVSVPSDCDRYLLKSVLHDWDNGDCLRILSNIRSAMPSGARLMVDERMLAARTLDDPSAVWLDLHMLCVTGGCERTLEEYRNLLGQAGFVLARAVPTELGFWVMEAMAK